MPAMPDSNGASRVQLEDDVAVVELTNNSLANLVPNSVRRSSRLGGI